MKRYLLIIILLILLMPMTKVKAASNKNLNYYVEIGIGNEDMLLIDGYTYLSGDVLWDKEGVYTVNYLNKDGEKTDVLFHITAKSLDNNYYYELQKTNKLNIDYNNYIIHDSFYLGDDSFYIVANDINPDIIEYDYTRISVLYFVNGILKWEYKYKTKAVVVKCCLNGDNLIVCGNTYTDPSTCIIFEISPTRQIKHEKILKGNENVKLKNMYIYDDEILLITETSSNDLDFKDMNPSKVNNVIILSLSMINWQVDSFLTLGNDNISIQTITADDNFLYLIIKNIDKNSYKFLKISSFLIIYNSHQISNIQSIIKSFVIDGQLYYISIKDKIISFYSLYQLICKISCDVSYNINLIVNKNEAYFLLYNNEKIDSIIKFNGDDYERITLDVEGKLINNGQFSLLIKSGTTINCFNLHLLEFIKHKQSGIDVIYNGVKYDPISELVFNNDIYGNYENIMYINVLDKYKVCYLEEVKVPLQINIEEHMTYDKGVMLLFNGHGKLGKLDIESGFVINEIGNYSLEIYGNVCQKCTINFSVEDLTKHPIIEEQPNISIDNIDFQEKRTQPIINNQYQVYSSKNQYSLIIAMIVVILGVLGILIWRKQKK